MITFVDVWRHIVKNSIDIVDADGRVCADLNMSLQLRVGDR